MTSKRTILLTGAAGFVGSHFVEHFLKNTEDDIIGVDCLNYSGTWDRLRDIGITGFPSAFEHPRFTPMTWDFRRRAEPNLIRELKEVTHVLHLGAESHVDSSIADPMKFVESNVVGTVNVLSLARELPELELVTYFGTDEVFGPAPLEVKKRGKTVILPNGAEVTDVLITPFNGYKESDRHNPKNPYAASKSAAEQMVVSFANTYNLPCIITRTMNVMGERQHAEKFIPKCIRATLEGETVHIHSTPDKKQAGVRSYIHARNVANAVDFLLTTKPYLSKPIREVESYHIVGELEIDNMKLARTIEEYTQIMADRKRIVLPKSATFEMVDFHSSRPGHDLRYALDGSKIKGLGWTPPKSFHESLRKTIEWYLDNPRWLGESK